MPRKTTFIVLVLAISLPAQAQVLEVDSLALVALYNSTDGANWTNSWDLNRPVDTWYGVMVSGRRVTWLSLYSNQLSGSIPAELGNLDSLTHLNLWSNQLSGPIPAELGSLANLTFLDLGTNDLNGSIPAELGILANLTYLNLRSNQLSGSIPAQLGNLANLTHLNLARNQLGGSTPAELGNLANLKRLYLYSNQFSGSIPAELGSLTNLEELWLNSNRFSGSVTPELGNLVNLKFFNLHNNQLSGSIPAELRKLANLTHLNLYNNQLSGSIPAELGNLVNLTNVYLYSNQLTGLPDLSTLTALAYLLVQNNRLTFKDLEPNKGVARNGFWYLPQDSVGMQLDTTITAGDTLWLTTSAGGTMTHYQWLLNGAAIEGATDSSYALHPRGSIDSGAYICEMTNSIVIGLTLYSRPVNVTVSGELAIPDAQLLPQAFALHQNYPNPFNPSTTIRFDLPAATEVHLAVYDLLGREVVRLVDGQLQAGYHQQVWNGRDRNGNEVPTGIYFVLVTTPEFSKSIKVVLLK